MIQSSWFGRRPSSRWFRPASSSAARRHRARPAWSCRPQTRSRPSSRPMSTPRTIAKLPATASASRPAVRCPAWSRSVSIEKPTSLQRRSSCVPGFPGAARRPVPLRGQPCAFGTGARSMSPGPKARIPASPCHQMRAARRLPAALLSIHRRAGGTPNRDALSAGSAPPADSRRLLPEGRPRHEAGAVFLRGARHVLCVR
jgi:hypothetical protein